MQVPGPHCPPDLFSRHFFVCLDRMPRKVPSRRVAWHPQGPIHPQPHPVPLQVVHPRSHAPRAVAWWRGGSPTCSGTGRLSGAVGPLWVPGMGPPQNCRGESPPDGLHCLPAEELHSSIYSTHKYRSYSCRVHQARGLRMIALLGKGPGSAMG